MRHIVTICLLLTALILLSAPVSAVDVRRGAFDGDGLDLSVRLVGGKGAVLMPGRDVNITFQTSEDAFVFIYNIDTDGYVNLLYPADGRPVRSEGRTVHFLPEAGRGIRWTVGERTGIEYIHAIAVPERSMIDENELAYLARGASLPAEKRFRIQTDPFLAFNTIDEEIVSEAGIAAMSADVTWFYINREVDYPRYLCASCHGHDRMSDPYAMVCPAIEIERVEYADADYPYEETFVVRHLDEDENDYYVADLGDRFDDADDVYDDGGSWEDWDDWDDADVHLHVYYNDWYVPRHSYHPWHWYVAWDPYWWDDWYWGWSWSVGWGGYYHHHWPFYSWYRPYYYASWYRNDWWWDYGYDGYWRHDDRQYRTIANGRTVTKRYLTYADTAARVRRVDAISGSRLARVKVKERRDRTIERSTLARRTTSATSARMPVVSRATGTTRPAGTTRTANRVVTRRVVHGQDARTARRDPGDTVRPTADPDSRRRNLKRTDGGSTTTPARGDDSTRRRSTRRERSTPGGTRSTSTNRTQPAKKSGEAETRRTQRPTGARKSAPKKSNDDTKRSSNSSARSSSTDRGIDERVGRASGRSSGGSSAGRTSSGSRSSGSRSSGSRSSGSGGGSKRRK
ncbi:MAG: DUF4384 domain-containing protein [Candidatus Krumholzibacteriota bacterium]|nr:DUF4384 domain-containing protein [Candidatus Krumholzibacteriota bacterium]